MIEEYKMYGPQAEFVMFEESDHNLQLEELSALFALIREFLNKLI